LLYTFASGVGGSSSLHLISTQIAQLEALATKPDVMMVQTLQNDYIQTKAQADSFCANVTTYTTRALAAGVKLVIITGRPPKSEPTDISALNYAQSVLRNFAAITPGVAFLDFMSVLKDPLSTNELVASPFIGWRGLPDNSATSFAADVTGVHPSFLAGRALAPMVSELFKTLCRPARPKAFIAKVWDPTLDPFGNVLGRSGLMVGTSGTLNGVANAGVAGTDEGTFPNRSREWALTTENGITVTPTITIGADGFRRQRLTFSGTPSAAAKVGFVCNEYFAKPLARWSSEALLDFSSVTGIQAFEVNNIYAGSATQAFPSPLTESYFIKERAVAPYSRAGGGTYGFNINFYFKAGVAASGYVEVGRCGLFREPF
jgi:hypothetical protein